MHAALSVGLVRGSPETGSFARTNAGKGARSKRHAACGGPRGHRFTDQQRSASSDFFLKNRRKTIGFGTRVGPRFAVLAMS